VATVRFNEEREQARAKRQKARQRAAAPFTAGRLQRRRERHAAGLERIAQARAAILARRAA
jgi:hypothetical protein